MLVVVDGAAGGVAGVRGSLYAYVVGLIAGAIGWGVLGAMEGVLAGVVDACLVCWGSETGAGAGGGGAGRRGHAAGAQARYCIEAGWLFGDDGGYGDGDGLRMRG
jgi:hypothetical protein